MASSTKTTTSSPGNKSSQHAHHSANRTGTSSTASVKSGSTSGRGRSQYEYQFQRHVGSQPAREVKAKREAEPMPRWAMESCRDEFWNPVSRGLGEARTGGGKGHDRTVMKL